MCGTKFNKPPELTMSRWKRRLCCSMFCGKQGKKGFRKQKTENKTCRYCGSLFYRKTNIPYKQWETQVCCSKECGDRSKATPWLESYKLKQGTTIGVKNRFKKRDKRIVGVRNNHWKGDDAGYTSKHQWASRWFGKPVFCEHCKTSAHRMYHWANISGKYLRDRNDWLRLCVPCHKKFDLSTSHEQTEIV